MMERVRALFDVRSGIWGAAIMAALVWWINSSHGAWPATTAALKQAAYTFVFGGLVMRWCAVLAQREGSTLARVAIATLCPSMLTIALVYGVHSTRGTPEPLLSTLPASFLAPVSFAVFAWRAKKNTSHSPNTPIG